LKINNLDQKGNEDQNIINNPNIKMHLGILKEYKNEIIEEDKIQILILEK